MAFERPNPSQQDESPLPREGRELHGSNKKGGIEAGNERGEDQRAHGSDARDLPVQGRAREPSPKVSDLRHP